MNIFVYGFMYISLYVQYILYEVQARAAGRPPLLFLFFMNISTKFFHEKEAPNGPYKHLKSTNTTKVKRIDQKRVSFRWRITRAQARSRPFVF